MVGLCHLGCRPQGPVRVCAIITGGRVQFGVPPSPKPCPPTSAPSRAAGAEPDQPDAPRWDCIDEQICCPLCEYNLRGLSEPRCPECGYRFEWPNLIDPSRRLHPTLFEHHPERNVWSFRRTLLGALRPRRFWRSIHPAQPRNVRRLLLYHAVGAFVLSASLTGVVGTTYVWQARRIAADRAITIAFMNSSRGTAWKNGLIRDFGSVEKYLDEMHPTGGRRLFWGAMQYCSSTIRSAALWLAWPWLTLLAFQLFPVTRRRWGIRPSHLLRCVVYSWDAAFPAALLIWLHSSMVAIALMRVGRYRFLEPWITGAGLVLLAVFAYRLVQSLRLYVRFPHPTATVVITQTVVAFVAFDAMIALNRIGW